MLYFNIDRFRIFDIRMRTFNNIMLITEWKVQIYISNLMGTYKKLSLN